MHLNVFIRFSIAKKTHLTYCAYKLDLAKAYDRVDWDFLEGAMEKMGFGALWISWIMKCVKSVRFSDVERGSAGSTFPIKGTPTR